MENRDLGTALDRADLRLDEYSRPRYYSIDRHFIAAISPGVKIPGGYDIYFFSGATAAVSNPTAPKGSVDSYGDIAVQTRSALDSLRSSLAKLGLSFADVVQARVYMTPDPAKSGGIDFAEMSKVWATEFGTADQPNRPVRAAVEVAGLIGPGLLIEIEMTAAKKPNFRKQ